eukprot:gene5245-7290_t
MFRTSDIHYYLTNPITSSITDQSLFSLPNLFRNHKHIFFETKIWIGRISVHYNNQEILFSPKEATAKLWPFHIPINITTTMNTTSSIKEKHNIIHQDNKQNHNNNNNNNIHINSSHVAIHHELNADFVQFVHGCFFSPSISTFTKAINNKWLSNFPRINANMVRQNPPHTISTSLGHLNQTRQGILSTKTKIKPLIVQPSTDSAITLTKIEQIPIVLNSNSSISQTEVSIKLLPISGTNFSDATGRFPTQSKHGSNYIFCSVYNNYIHVEPMHGRRASDYVKVFEKTYTFLKKHGITPALQMLDNETSNMLQNYLEQEKIRYQFLPPDDHRANRAER